MDCEWKLLQTKAIKGSEVPKALSHHTSVVWNGAMYVYGGCKASGEENQTIFSLDVNKLLWSHLVIVSFVFEDFFISIFYIETWEGWVYSFKPR